MRKLLRRGVRGFIWIIKGLPLLLAVAAASLWVRSYVRQDAIYQSESWIVPTQSGPEWHTSVLWIVSDSGRLTVRKFSGFMATAASDFMGERKLASPVDWKWTHDAPPFEFPATTWTRLGFACTTLTEGDGQSYHWDTRVGSVPHWLPTAIFVCLAVPCAKRLRRRWSIRRVPEGVFCACGYDLRATPERCPECGTVPAGTTRC